MAVADQVYRKRHQGRHYFSQIDTGGNNVSFGATATSTTSAAVTATSIKINTLEDIGVTVYAVGRMAGGSGNHYYGAISGLFYRESGGNVTQSGSSQAVFTAINSGSWTGVAFSADTSNQEIDITVATSGSDTASWNLQVEYHKVKTST